MTSPLMTAPADSSHSSLATVPAVGAVLWTSTAVGAVFIYTQPQGNALDLGTRQMWSFRVPSWIVVVEPYLQTLCGLDPQPYAWPW